MPILGIMLTLFWILVIAWPELLSILVWITFILIWWNILLIYFAFSKWKRDIIKFWSYEIYKNKK